MFFSFLNILQNEIVIFTMQWSVFNISCC